MQNAVIPIVNILMQFFIVAKSQHKNSVVNCINTRQKAVDQMEQTPEFPEGRNRLYKSIINSFFVNGTYSSQLGSKKAREQVLTFKNKAIHKKINRPTS